jgi:enoyl-CoA hydratase/carnithine racemase
MNDRVLVDIRDGIATVTMNRPDKYNGLDWDMFKGLVAAGRRLRRDRSVRAVILRGEGRAFSTGLDVASFAKSPFKAFRMITKYGVFTTNLAQEAAWVWRSVPVPVIAVMHGRCYGGAFQLALAADFRIATPDCECSIMETKWGLVPDMTGTVTLRELVPMDVAMRLTLSGELFSGTRAKELNLVTEVADDPLAAAQELAAQIAARSPDAVAGAKSLFHRTWPASVRRALRIETWIQYRMFMGKNQKIAARANSAKQQPKFLDRSFKP